jgi:RNase P subunit RPR2
VTTVDGAYRFAIDCPRCEDLLVTGPLLTVLMDMRGYPIIPVDRANHLAVTCPGCGAEVHTSELPIYARGDS